jgi:hypothetical protein
LRTRQGYRFATSTGGVLTGRGADIILIEDPLKLEEARSDNSWRMKDEWLDRWPDGVCSSAGRSSRSRAGGIGITLSGRRPAFAQAEHAGTGGPAFAIPRPGLALRLCSIAGQPRAKGGD